MQEQVRMRLNVVGTQGHFRALKAATPASQQLLNTFNSRRQTGSEATMTDDDGPRQTMLSAYDIAVWHSCCRRSQATPSPSIPQLDKGSHSAKKVPIVAAVAPRIEQHCARYGLESDFGFGGRYSRNLKKRPP